MLREWSIAMTFGSSQSSAFKQRVKLRVMLACTLLNEHKKMSEGQNSLPTTHKQLQLTSIGVSYVYPGADFRAKSMHQSLNSKC